MRSKARIVLDKRPETKAECPMYICKDIGIARKVINARCFDGERCCNVKDCKKIVSLAELMCGETADLYL